MKENEDGYEDEYEEESADENQDEDPVEDTGVPSSVSPVAGGEKEMGLFSRMIHFIHVEHRWM